MKPLMVILLALRAGLLQNPSFEEPAQSPDLPAHWNRWGSWLNRETAWVPTRTGKCLIGYHYWQIESPDNSGLWQDVMNLKAGQRLKFAVFVWFDQTEASAQELELKLEATRLGRQVTIESAKFSPKDFPREQWHQFSVTGTTPEDHVRVLLIVTPAPNAPRGGAVKFDDATLEIVAPGEKQTKGSTASK
jgi:hypothetical protein